MPGSKGMPAATRDSVFAGPIPEIYERLLVPLLFAPYAEDIAARVAALAPRRVLETAAGTGAVTRRIAALLPADGTLVATDLNPAMLETAKSGATDPRIVWQLADALALPFEDASFDTVVCQFGVMFFPDRRQGFAEARRVLAPGGTLIFSVWDHLAANLLPAAASEALAALFPQDPPLFFVRTPYGHASLDRLREEVEAAGLGGFTAEVVRRPGRIASAQEAGIAFCQGTPLRAEIEERAPGRLGEVTDKVAQALGLRFGTGPIEAPLQALVMTARC
ncbi:MAG: SAM-dependent methyltransferase PhcB [Xanthobacteraceae bacterium]|nr:SAM-dependent methyltransferase PhcB [Xanthobacteraceae bacterium]